MLEQFCRLSGLRCNFEKTNLMLVGGADRLRENLQDIGYNITDRIKLLGFDIDNNLEDLTQNFDKAIVKIRNIISFWERFRLSVPGRINIAKTFLYSQLGYYGAILNPNKQQITIIENLIYKFVNPINLAKHRLTIPPAVGGLGIFGVTDYVTSLQVGWVKRAYLRTHDNWSHDLKRLSHGLPILLHPFLVDKRKNPIIFNFANS